jgi:hypothetical protein
MNQDEFRRLKEGPKEATPGGYIIISFIARCARDAQGVLKNHLKTKINNNILLLWKSGRRIGQAPVPKQSASELQLSQVIFALLLIAHH